MVSRMTQLGHHRRGIRGTSWTHWKADDGHEGALLAPVGTPGVQGLQTSVSCRPGHLYRQGRLKDYRQVPESFQLGVQRDLVLERRLQLRQFCDGGVPQVGKVMILVLS